MRDEDEVLFTDMSGFRFHVGDHVIYFDDNGDRHQAVILDRCIMYNMPNYVIAIFGREPILVSESSVHT